MEDRLISQVKRIYHDTKQAINECSFSTKQQFDQLLLTPSEEKLILNVDGSQASLIKAATLLRELHTRFLRTFVLSAFDLTWDMITTPKRFEYAKQKELELYNSLMSISDLKQDEIKLMIRETINSIKQDLLNSIVNITFSNDSMSSMQSSQNHSSISLGTNKEATTNRANNRTQIHNQLLVHKDTKELNDRHDCDHLNNSSELDKRNGLVHHEANEQGIDGEEGELDNEGDDDDDDDDGIDSEKNLVTNERQQCELKQRFSNRSVESSGSHLTNTFSANSLENISSRTELQLYRQEIQEIVLQQLNESIASKLVGSVESLRNSYVGTLERCLASLEQHCCGYEDYSQDYRDYLACGDNLRRNLNRQNICRNNRSNNNFNQTTTNNIVLTYNDFRDQNSYGSISEHPPYALMALRQILNAAYRVEVTVHSSTSVLRVLWEKMKQLMANSLPIWGFYWNNYGCIIDDQWKRQQALDILNNLSESRLAKSICSQFRARLKASHEQFIQSIKDLEQQHAGRLQHTEELRLRVRKMHAPRMAKYALESTSLIDLILHGMPSLEKEIGRGQYGVVYACESWAGNSPCAVKSVVPPDDKHWYDLAMEFYYTRCIPEHERVVNIYGSVIDHSYGSGSTPAVLLIMERLNKDLYSAIKTGLDWLSRLQVAIDVVEGMRYLHNQGLVHRDIKLKNILLDANNRAKLTDLGFCKPEAMMSGSVVGTPIHMSPELFSGRYDNSVDVYAFGILFWYICAGHVRLPHIFEQCQTRDQLWNCVRRGVRPERLPQFDNECWQLMVQCWDGDRTKRPHLGDVEIRLRQIHARYT